ncbi:Kelch-like protein 33 [Merluccius polli]|uniref:Kelch-like protein 33 n=1 Tax=Merluccius polli TaxID=89951 RepID=A0AA47NRV9_MERPO|nr:Kelch-like protein 33 [Merluccius polli]
MEVAQPYLQDGLEEDWKREIKEKKRRRNWKERLICLILRMRRSGRYSEDDGREEEEDEDDNDNEDKKQEDELKGDGMKELEIDLQVETKVDRDENVIIKQWKERHEEKDKTDAKRKHLKQKTDRYNTPGSPKSQEEELNDGRENLLHQQEDSTDDEDIGVRCSTEDDAESVGENVVKVYTKDNYPTNIFQTLTEFRDSCFLTDLTLSTEDGDPILSAQGHGRTTFCVHSPVLAAISSLVRDTLKQRDKAKSGEGDRREVAGDETDPEIQSWSLSLGPDLSLAGLQAVLEFAYSGDVVGLNGGMVAQVRAAAHALGVPRVLEFCDRESQQKISSKNRNNQVEGMKNHAADQMESSLRAINELRLGKVGCDVLLEAVGASVPAHRIILAASSDYFLGMFTHGMKESRQSTVVLPFLLASELEALIGCSYSGDLPLSWEGVFEITGLSLQLQYQPALSLCLNFLQNEINPNTCLDVASFAKAYDMEQLLKLADDFALRQFQWVSRTTKFRCLPAKKLLKYLNSHSLCISSELVVFKAVVAWIQYKPKKRSKLAKQLMRTIHFPLMTFKEFEEVQATNIWAEHKLVALYEKVLEDFCSNATAPLSQCRVYFPKDTLVLVGGDQISEDFSSRRTSRELWFGNSLRNHTGIVKSVEWRRLGEMPEPSRFSHEIAVLNGQLYIIGGRKYYGRDDILNSAYRYDPLGSGWERLSDMREQRCCFSVVVLGEMLYAIGGDSNPGCLESVECYCPANNSWSFSCPLDMALTGHSAKVLDKQIFICGGFGRGYQCWASMSLYHPERGSSGLSDMSRPRAHHCMEALGGHLYVAGGVTTDDGDIMATINQLACEAYNPAANCWTAFEALPVPHVGAGSTVMEGRFYVLGGSSHKDDSDTRMVHRYDPALQHWENMGVMPGLNTDIRAAILCLPPQLRS